MGRSSSSGFTLIETLLSLALIALVVGMLTLFTKQYLMNWQTGLARLDEGETLALAELAVRRDLDALLILSPTREYPLYSFEGKSDSVRFFYQAPKPVLGRPFVALEFRAIDGTGLIRSATPYDGAMPLTQIQFPKGETLLSSPYTVRFLYRDDRGLEQPEWQSRDVPRIITIVVLDEKQKPRAYWPIQILPRIASLCVKAKSLKACQDLLQSNLQGALQ